MFGWPRKPWSTSGFGGTLGYCRLGLMDFSNSYNPYVLDVKESVFGSFAQPCLGDLENLGQLPVLQELEGTDNLVLCIFVISSLPTFQRSKNIFLAVRKATMFEWPRKSRSTSGFGGTLGYCRLGLMDFSYFYNPYEFDVKETDSSCLSKLQGSGDLENSG